MAKLKLKQTLQSLMNKCSKLSGRWKIKKWMTRLRIINLVQLVNTQKMDKLRSKSKWEEGNCYPWLLVCTAYKQSFQMCEPIVVERDFSFTTHYRFHCMVAVKDMPPPTPPSFLNSELKQRRFWATNVTESGLLAFLGNVFAQTFAKIVSVRHSVRHIC